MKKTITIDTEFVLGLRKAQNLNQSEFWSKFGVTQSGGSRYESGRNIPKPLRRLIWLVEVVGIGQDTTKMMQKV